MWAIRCRAGEGAACRVASKGKEWLDKMTMQESAAQEGGWPDVVYMDAVWYLLAYGIAEQQGVVGIS